MASRTLNNVVRNVGHSPDSVILYRGAQLIADTSLSRIYGIMRGWCFGIKVSLNLGIFTTIWHSSEGIALRVNSLDSSHKPFRMVFLFFSDVRTYWSPDAARMDARAV